MTDNYNSDDNYRSDDLTGDNESVYSDNSGEKNYTSESTFKSEEYSGQSSFAYTSENSSKPKKNSKFGVACKCGVVLLASGVIVAGVVQISKFLNNSKPELIQFSGNTGRSITNSVKDEDEDEKDMPSLIELASRADAKPIPDIVDSIMPSVVGVASTFEFEPQSSFSIWGWSPEPQMQKIRSTGTGFIITDDGYIVTNAHVVYDTDYDAGEAIEVTVLFSDETEHEANIIAYDSKTDIAVLKVNETKLTPAILGDSDDLRVGELVIAVGNPLGFDLFGTVTSGIISALNRKIDINEKKINLIQTDAAINSGNSGGPLLNSCGQVIGINSAKMSSSYSSNLASIEGLCFAIPIKEAKAIIDDLINYKYVTGRPQLGLIGTKDITEAQSHYWNIPVGVLVISMEEDGAVDRAGIKPGDVIIDIDGNAVSTRQELNEINDQFKAGDTIPITVSRNGQDIKISVTLQEDKNVTSNKKHSFERY